jgi:hypothetical protein
VAARARLQSRQRPVGRGVHGPARGKPVAASDPVQRDAQRLPKVPESLAPCDGAGHQVAPAELEALLATHPLVADAAVVGRPDPERGEIPVAMVVARDELDPEALMAWVAERVAPYKRIREVRLVDAIPRTPAGKILRRLLRVTA